MSGNGLRSDEYKSYMKHYTFERFDEALVAIDGAIKSVSGSTSGEQLERGALILRKGIVLHRLGRLRESTTALAEAEGLLDALTFSAHLAPFYARHGNDVEKALLHTKKVLDLLNQREQQATLDDGEQYYRRTALEIEAKGGRL